jgi:hypothetical protein
MSVTIDGFGLVSVFIERLYTQLVTTSNFNSLTSLHTIEITVTAAHISLLSSLAVSW